MNRDAEEDIRFSPEAMKAAGYERSTIEEGYRAVAARKEGTALIEKITKAFESVPRPRVTLRVARALDDEWIVSEERGLELREEDPESDWKEVSPEKIHGYQEYFAFSDDASGWLFYLPAFMCDHLRELPYYGWDAAYVACKRIRPDLRLTDGQLACVGEFIELCERYEPELLR